MNADLETRVWVERGLADVRPATLRLVDERVSLVLVDGAVVVEAAVRDVSFESRWYWFDSAFELVAPEGNYRILLVMPGADEAQVGAARSAGTAWKSALRAASGQPGSAGEGRPRGGTSGGASTG